MKQIGMLVVAAVLSIGSAKADGFTCSSTEGLNVKVFNETAPEAGTRNPAVMILSDASISGGHKTIARFDADNSVLNSAGASYVSHVDLRYTDSARKGELIGGTKLGQLRDISLDVDFLYSEPVSAGKKLAAILTLTKRNGAEIQIEMLCKRYLKN